MVRNAVSKVDHDDSSELFDILLLIRVGSNGERISSCLLVHVRLSRASFVRIKLGYVKKNLLLTMFISHTLS